MFEQTIFYILGSIFFFIVIVLLAFFLYYAVLVLRNIVRISTTVQEVAEDVKKRVESLSAVMAGIVTAVEKIKNNLEEKSKNKK